MAAPVSRRLASETSSTFRGWAMGSTLDIEVHGDPGLIEVARRRLAQLESDWSRFLPDSEISRCNTTRGVPVFVGRDTRSLVRHGISAWQRTAERCDPTVLDALVAAGYDRSFDALPRVTDDALAADTTRVAAPGCERIEIDDELGSVTLPVGTGFDPGAIGKGLAADIVAEELMEAGAAGVFISLGGDLRALGAPVGGDGWVVDILEPSVREASLGTIVLSEGAVATSTDRKRRWTRAGIEHHHVIDPLTGSSASATPALVTTIAGAAWWAEALATQLMLTEPDGWADAVGDDGALIVDAAGHTHVIGRMNAHLR
jgi:thiamine biosynthesis lipoprotein